MLPNRQSGRQRVQRYRCHACGATFSEPQAKPLGDHRIELEKATHVLRLMMEGVSFRAIERLTWIYKSTILGLLLTAGEKCSKVFDARIQNVSAHIVQVDSCSHRVASMIHALLAWGESRFPLYFLSLSDLPLPEAKTAAQFSKRPNVKTATY